MKKWQSNLIILSIITLSLQLMSEDIDQLFYSKVVQAPEKGTVQKQSQNEVQIAPKNDTITNDAEKAIHARTEKAVSQPSEKAEAVQSSLDWAKFNQMEQTQLEGINGIGPVLAKRILEYRKEHGPFQTFEQLNQVKGIGPKLLEKIKSQFK